MRTREKERKITIGFWVKQQQTVVYKETERNEEKTVKIKTQQGCCGGRFKRVSYLIFS